MRRAATSVRMLDDGCCDGEAKCTPGCFRADRNGPPALEQVSEPDGFGLEPKQLRTRVPVRICVCVWACARLCAHQCLCM